MEDSEMATPEDTMLDSKKPLKFQKSTISCIQECETSDAERLCIFDIGYKLEYSDEYDVAGTFTNKKPELWFYIMTEICPSDNLLLNLFVCHRNVGFFSVGISKSSKLKTEPKHEDYVFLHDDLIWKSFKSSKPDQCHFIKTFNFYKTDLEGVFNNKALIIPLKLKVTPTFGLNITIVEKVQAKHNIGNIIKQQQSDFTLESASHKKFPTHKIMLCTHSPVLRDLIKSSLTTDSMFFDIKDEIIELFLEYIYSGNIQDINKYESEVLLELAEKFKLNNLYPLIETTIRKKVCIENALDIAKLSQKYQLKEVEKSVFKFFKENPEVLETDAWKNLNDIVLTKKLFEHIYFDK
ncbi:uncharacterized protein LOC125063390 [Pieris napi]|uniref:uncharacterized protein LOC125063390 n=1 Tax=Pieris napi TaxID=78633 RepID=UPI001FBB6502|nr:uncharacterized protein LOC125063390 [Pieris napi]